MKLDLDEIERNARIVSSSVGDPMDDGPALAIGDPEVVLALVKRIRELEAGLEDARYWLDLSEERERDRAKRDALLFKNLVMP